MLQNNCVIFLFIVNMVEDCETQQPNRSRIYRNIIHKKKLATLQSTDIFIHVKKFTRHTYS